MSTYIESAHYVLNKHGVAAKAIGKRLEARVKVDGHVGRLVVRKVLGREIGLISIEVLDLHVPAVHHAAAIELICRVAPSFYLGQFLFNPDTGRVTARISLPLQYGDLLEDEIVLLLMGCDSILKLLLPRLKKVMDGTATPVEAADLNSDI